jgi:hypothetical protein
MIRTGEIRTALNPEDWYVTARITLNRTDALPASWDV